METSDFRTRFELLYRSQYDGAEPTDFTPLDFVGALGSIGNALLYSKLFLPDFIEVDGSVFIKDFVDDLGGPDGVRRLRSKIGGGRVLERAINSFDINLNLPNRLNENSEGDDLLLAYQLAKMWGLRLRELYADRRFHVWVEDADCPPTVIFNEEG